MSDESNEFDHIGLSELDQIDDVCTAFENAWRAGERPAIEDRLAKANADIRSALLAELLRTEIAVRSELGHHPAIEEYASRFPEQIALLNQCLQNVTKREIPRQLDNSDPLPTLTDCEDRPQEESTSPRVGPFRLLKSLGEGGMGTVYMADQLEPIRRRVALKLIKSGMDSKQVIARFEAERQALAMMDHQNIARVLDAGIAEDGKPYFAMELVQGLPITTYCDQQKLSIADRLQLFVQVCRALQHAHQKGVIHRDIKPSNVLVTQRDGKPVAKVIDFGLAKAMQTELRLTDKTLFTAQGQVFGTLEYMSPEQAEMNELGLDTRTDVYSLGVLLYELLTGSTPLGRERIRREAFHRVLELIVIEEPPRPSRRLSDSGKAITGISEQRRIEPHRLDGILRGELDWIALKALEKDRERRYDGAASLADDVQHYLDGDVVIARPPTAGYRLQKTIRRHKAAFISGTIFLLLLLAGVIGTGTMWLEARKEARRANAAERKARDETQKAKAAEATAVDALARERNARQEAESSIYASQIQLAQRLWQNGAANNARRILDECQPNLRGWEHRYLARLTSENQRTFKGRNEGRHGVAFSPNGKWIASTAHFTKCKVWNASNGEELFTAEHNRFAFSPNGKWIARAGSDNTIQMWDAATGQVARTFKGHDGDIRCVAFSLDGTQLASGSNDATLKVWNVATGQEVQTLIGHDHAVTSAAFSPDGTRVIGGRSGITAIIPECIRVWEISTGKELLALEGWSRAVFSPTGQLLAGTNVGNIVKVWDAESGQEIQTIDVQDFDNSGVVFDPDGSRIITRSASSLTARDAVSGQQLWTIEGSRAATFSSDGTRIATGRLDGTVGVYNTETGQEIRTIKVHNNLVQTVAFSPNGTQIASGGIDNTVKVCDMVTGQVLQTFKGHDDRVNNVAFSPDGTQIVSASSDKTVKVWSADQAQEPFTLKGDPGLVSCIAFSHDGRRLATASWPLGRSAGVRVWSAVSGMELQRLKGSGESRSVAFSPDGRQVAANRHSRVQLWDASDGQPAFTLNGYHQNGVYCIDFSLDGTRLVSAASGGMAMLSDVSTGEILQTFSGHYDGVYCIAIRRDGALVLTAGSDKTIRVWDATTGQPIRSLNGHDGAVNSVAFHPDGGQFASGSEDATVKVWDTTSGQPLLTLTGHDKSVTSVVYSRDGKRIVSGSHDSTVKIWDAVSGHELLSLKAHDGRVTSVAFSRDGRRIASGSDNKTVKVWDAGP